MIVCCKLTSSRFIAPVATHVASGANPRSKVAGFDPFPTGWFYPTADNRGIKIDLLTNGMWAEVLLLTPEISKAKSEFEEEAEAVECLVAKLKFQGVVPRYVEDKREQLNSHMAAAYHKAWEVDSRTWYAAP